MYFNLIHRPSLSNAYQFQRECAHELKLKVTQMVSSRLLDNDEVVKMVKEDNEKYGDEIALWLVSKPGSPVMFPWLTSQEEKEISVKYAVDKFIEKFGFSPKVAGNYVLDANLVKILKNYCPTIEIAVAGCFEEGVRVFHGCNHSWYLFSEGMSWNPWYISKTHSLRPAENEEDWSGVIGLPHLSRDLAMSFEGRDDFYASHPANIQRGLVNDGLNHNYDYNLVDQYRMQEDFNNGFSYYQIHVSPGWLEGNPYLIDDDDVTKTLYYETLAYMAKLKEENKVVDLTVGEFADIYKKEIKIGKSEIGVGKDILYGSGKQFFWICNSNYRVLVDTFQGGSIGDFRPFKVKYASYTGSDTKALAMNSYPYLIQSQFRTGTKNHYTDGSRTTLLVTHKDETLDLCNYKTKIAEVLRSEEKETLKLAPLTVKFTDGLEMDIETVLDFMKNGDIKISRNILRMSDRTQSVVMTEYFKGCFGFTEYPEDMRNIKCFVGNTKVFDYKYDNNSAKDTENSSVSVEIPDINTRLTLSSLDNKAESVEISEGHLFNPYYTMKLNYKLDKDTKEVSSWISLNQIKE